MFEKLRKRFQRWAEEVVRRENARLRQESLRLKEEIERETGRPIQLIPEHQIRLAELSKRMDPETLKRISVFGPENIMDLEIEKESKESFEKS